MYKIIGADRQEYGPETADQIRQWIAEGRANGHTLVRAEGTADWKPLSAFPEFAAALASAPVPPPLPAYPAAAARPVSGVDELLAREPDFDIGSCFGRGLHLLRDNVGLLVGATLLIGAFNFVSIFIPFAHAFLNGVFFGGLYLVYLKRIRGQPAFAGEVFGGFGPCFAQLLLAGFLSSLLTGIASCFCTVPGIFLKIAWLFCIPLAADKRLEFWTAMELSRRVVTRVWFKVFGLFLVAFAPFIVAELFVTFKTMSLMFANLYPLMNAGTWDFPKIIDALKQMETIILPFHVLAQFILVLNLPVAVAALMYAYEDLFGPRTTPGA